MPIESIESAKLLQHQNKALGFYAMYFLESIGYCAGYLVLSRTGRPVEFHCTMPLQPNRSQQILFGESLVPHLLCDHIGPPLIKRAKTPVQAVLVQQQEALGLQANISMPVVAVDLSDDEGAAFHMKAEGASSPARVEASVFPNLDWNESFQRIESAIDEAHAVAR